MSINRKSILSVLIVLCMICALFPATALADVVQTVEAINTDVGTIDDNVAVTADSTDACGVDVEARNDDAGANVTGTVTASNSASLDAYGVYVYANNGNTATVGAGDTAASSAGDDAVGVNVMTVGAGTEANITTGAVTAESGDDGYGVSNSSNGASSSTITTGDINVTAGYYGHGIDSDAINDTNGTTSVEITSGNIEVEGCHNSYGVSVGSKNTGSGEAVTTVTVGDVSVAADSDHTAYGIYAKAEGDGAYMTVNAQNVFNAVELYAENGGSTTLNVDGDVAGEDTAIKLVPVGEESEINVDVDGTIDGETLGVGVKAQQNGGEYEVESEVAITAWKIEVNDDDHGLGFVTDQGIIYNDASEAMEKNILYYVKTDDAEGATLSAVDGSGMPVDAVTEGTTVFLKVDVQEGYTVNGAFNGKGERVPLQQDASGNYYVEVERGGGVFLSVSTEKIELYGFVIIIYREDKSVEAKFFVQRNDIKIEKTGEPDEAAMQVLSAGIDGACIYKASYAFTDDLANHGNFLVNFMLPGYEGQTVTVATAVNGEQVLYRNLRVGSNSAVAFSANRLGDFAVFLG